MINGNGFKKKERKFDETSKYEIIDSQRWINGTANGKSLFMNVTESMGF